MSPAGAVALEQLWAGWRSQYVSAATDADRLGGHDECVFCAIAQSGPPSADNLMVWRGEHAFCVLNAYPYGSGHLLVLPLRHLASLTELSSEESIALWEAAQAAVGALERAYRPDGANLGANLGRSAGAGIPGHLHLHVLPRWSGDTNFMTSVAGVRVLPEPLGVSWEKVHGAWT